MSGYAEPAIELRDQIEAGAVAQANFAEISARTIGKKRFDRIKAMLGGITAKKEPPTDGRRTLCTVSYGAGITGPLPSSSRPQGRTGSGLRDLTSETLGEPLTNVHLL